MRIIGGEQDIRGYAPGSAFRLRFAGTRTESVRTMVESNDNEPNVGALPESKAIGAGERFEMLMSAFLIAGVALVVILVAIAVTMSRQ